MKFLVSSISSYSAKANVISLTFVETNTNLDNKTVKVFAPKSVQLIEGKIQDVPYFVCKNIWNSFLTSDNLKNIQKEYQNEAKPGQKRASRDIAIKDFNEAEKLNIDVPKLECEKIGNYVADIGDTLILNLKIDKCVSSNSHTGFNWVQTGYGWGHPTWTTCLWRLLDEKNNVYMLKSSSEKINNILETSSKLRMVCKITNHEEFRDTRQNIIEVSSDKALTIIED